MTGVHSLVSLQCACVGMDSGAKCMYIHVCVCMYVSIPLHFHIHALLLWFSSLETALSVVDIIALVWE